MCTSQCAICSHYVITTGRTDENGSAVKRMATHSRVTLYLPTDFIKAVKIEAIERGKSFGDLVVEAFDSRQIRIKQPDER